MCYITSHILDDLKKKMVFVGGPRQVGKTTLAKAILTSSYPDGRYLNPKKAVQIVAEIKRPYDKGKIRVTDPISYFRQLLQMRTQGANNCEL